MPWPRAAQRILLVAATGLLVLSVLLVAQEERRPAVVPVPDDPRLDVRLDLNSAAAADLETLPGVGKALAERIGAYRSQHGPFRSVSELRQVPGFGEKLVQAVQPYLTVEAR
jgi:competence ComEA-like helix-hairpin-helix protein